MRDTKSRSTEINVGGISLINAWKGELTRPEFPPAPMAVFKPLKSHWTIGGHAREGDMAAFRAIPSAYADPSKP